jgi:energy-coupling factor transporter ATP-binding protein EcfA2
MLNRSEAEGMAVRGKGGLADYARNHPEEHNWTGKEIIRLKKEDFINQFVANDGDGSLPFPKTPEAPKTNKSHDVAQGSTDNLADILAKALDGKIQGSMDETAVRDIATAIIDQRLDNFKPAIHEIKVTNIDAGTSKDVGIQHKAFENILKLAAMRENIMLVGPAGSGKTTACANVAKALDLKFESMSVCMQTTKSDLLGYIDANSNYVSTRLRECYETGGVFLLDEIDSGNPNVLTVINALSENGHGPFPDKTIARHEDFILIAAANTWGLGGNIEYVGRNPIDAATRDRFAMVSFDYDEDLERALSSDDSWADRVQMIRMAINELREKNVMATPRAAIKGSRMLANGFSREAVEDMMIFKGINPEIKNRVLGRV